MAKGNACRQSKQQRLVQLMPTVKIFIKYGIDILSSDHTDRREAN